MTGNAIQETLNDLHKAPGVKGCVLVTHDGLIVAQALGNKFREDVIAGLASYLVMSTDKVLRESDLGRFDQFTIHAAHGKAVFVDLEGSFLVVLLDQFADIEASRPEIHGTAQRLRRSSRLTDPNE